MNLHFTRWLNRQRQNNVAADDAGCDDVDGDADAADGDVMMLMAVKKTTEEMLMTTYDDDDGDEFDGDDHHYDDDGEDQDAGWRWR